MANSRITNRILAHCRTIFALAVVPLATLPGETIVGCGCGGHFDAVCHCECCHDECRPNHAARTGSCCCHHSAISARKTNRQIARTDDHSQYKTHQCVKVVLHTGDSLTATAPHLGDVHQLATILPASFGAAAEIQASLGESGFAFNSGPPDCDVVITLRDWSSDSAALARSLPEFGCADNPRQSCAIQVRARGLNLVHYFNFALSRMRWVERRRDYGTTILDYWFSVRALRYAVRGWLQFEIIELGFETSGWERNQASQFSAR